VFNFMCVCVCVRARARVLTFGQQMNYEYSHVKSITLCSTFQVNLKEQSLVATISVPRIGSKYESRTSYN